MTETSDQILRVKHRTTYRYSEPVLQARNDAWLLPRDTPTQRVLEHAVAVEPTPESSGKRVDYFGNEVASFDLTTVFHDMVVTATSRVAMIRRNLPDPEQTLPWDQMRSALDQDFAASVDGPLQFRYPSQLVRPNAEFLPYIHKSFLPGRPLFSAAAELSSRIYKDFRYTPGATKVDTPPEAVFRDKRGVCQDYAHFLIACLRTVGVPARYVSGYLRSRPEFVGFEASHAWASFYCPDFGWIDLDPTNNVIPSTSHVVICWGRDYRDVPPLRGVVLGGGDHTVDVSVGVVPEPVAP